MAKPKRKKLNLALQGGGSHGAFTWGVLDRLLEEDLIALDSISGTSAGAMNAVALADGWQRGGADGARDRLAAFWERVGEKGQFSPFRRLPFHDLLERFSINTSPALRVYDLWSRVVSPYDVNLLDINPLRDVVREMIDFDNVRACDSLKIFISATNVLTGKGRVFSGQDISLDAVMASACLPTVFKAVEIDGVPYWDGGFAGNPVLHPFFYESETEDCLLIQINPIEREGTPKTAMEIQDRINEITFNSGLLREFRAIEFVRRLKDSGRLESSDYIALRMHRISADAVLEGLSASSKLNAEPSFIDYLFEMGRAAADDFLDTDFEKVGKEATLDLSEEIRSDIMQPRSHERGFGRHMQDAIRKQIRKRAT